MRASVRAEHDTASSNASLLSTGSGPVWQSWLEASLSRLATANLTRHVRPVAPSGSSVTVRSRLSGCALHDNFPAIVSQKDLESWANQEEPKTADQISSAVVHLKLFSLNDYLGLSTHPKIRQAVAEAALSVGNGPRSSALIGGFTIVHGQLEEALADLKGTQDCLLFPSGFAANLATLSTLAAGPDCAIFSDALNHASIIDGCRLAMRAGAQLHVYRHCDLHHLASLLQKAHHPRRLVVTDSLFSMDGDYANLRGLVELKHKFGFLLVIDEAHATLLCGDRGGGAAEAQKVSSSVDIHVGTLSKAAGCHGGFVACSKAMRALLLNRGRPFVFSTALPVPTAAGALAAIRVACHEETWRKSHVAELTRLLGERLGVSACSPIVPVMVGSERRALAASAALLRRGFHVPAIRPPTVPAGTSRLRISLSAAHTTEDVECLAAAIRQVLSDLGVAMSRL